ncbi:MAG TPA: sulfotransferase [Stellaceae bacterium]|jgi:tetratricopeptide (TPR) repeat protein|nr:sulfotransferase [Stellaceae bacterium]
MSLQTALSLHQQGRLAEAESLYQALLDADRDHFDVLHALGILRCQQRRYEEARGLFLHALRQKPGSPEAHYNLATALEGLKHPEEAVLHYREALALRPDFYPAHNNLANVLKALDQREEAIVHYRRALAIRPDFAIAHNNLANTLQALGRRDEAETHYRRAIGFKPDYAEAHNNLGNVLRVLGRGEEAVQCYRRALAFEPRYLEAHNNLGNALKELGQFEEAAASFKKALELDPKCVAAYHDLALATKVKADEPWLAAMEKLASDSDGLKPRDRAGLHFALAKTSEDLERHDEAFRHMLAANALKRREIAYDEARTFARFARIRELVTAELLRQKAGSGDPSRAPIFILGMPRSGTTLVEQILASHPDVFGAGEIDDLTLLAEAMPYPEGLPEASADQLRALGAGYVAGVRARAGAALWITDKMPSNFYYVGLIRLALPNARIIHTRRDPIDTCLSCFSKLFVGVAQPFSYDLRELGRYWRQYDALMAHWRQVLPEGAMLEIPYEELVADLETQARRLVAYCGLDWNDACLAFHETRRAVRTASAVQVRHPVYKSAVGRWRIYEEQLAPLIEELKIPR